MKLRPVAAIVCIVLIAVSTVGCGNEDVATSSLVPGFLIGTWRTDVASHRRAFLRLTSTTIAFGTIEGTIERYSVTRVTRTRDLFGELYTIEYRDIVGDRYTVGLYYDDQTVRLRNQRQMPWTWARF